MPTPPHTPGPWRPSKGCKGEIFGAVVADHPVPGMRGSGAVGYYGGHLVAESIAPLNRPLIYTAPDLYDFIATLENDDGKIPAWLWDKRENLLARARGETE